MPLPREAVYNELNGAEVKAILQARVAALLDSVPYLQRHLTLPRVRMVIQVELIVRADQQGAERHRVADDFIARTDVADPADLPSDTRLAGHDTVDASPGPAGRGHKTAGEIRYEAGLPDAVPTKGPIATEDAMLRATDVPMPPDAAFGRLPTEQEKIGAYRQQQAERIANDEKDRVGHIPLEPPPPPATLPGVMVERGRRQTSVTMDRGGPAIGTASPAPVESPTLRNSGAAPDRDLFGGTDFRDSKRKDGER